MPEQPSPYEHREGAGEDEAEKIFANLRKDEEEIESRVAREDPRFWAWEKSLPTPEQLKEPHLPPSGHGDLFRKAESLLGEQHEATFLLDEDAADEHNLERMVLLRRGRKGISMSVQSRSIDDPDVDRPIIEATRFSLQPEDTRLVFAVGDAETQERLDEPIRVKDLDEKWMTRIAWFLEHLEPGAMAE